MGLLMVLKKKGTRIKRIRRVGTDLFLLDNQIRVNPLKSVQSVFHF